jgi:hypothetical protein
MATSYTNIPPNKITADANIQAYDTYYSTPLEVSASTLDAMKSFFTARGFESIAAESVALVIIKQAKKDNLNPLEILDTLKGLGNAEISALVAEIINYNRFRTSFLGYALAFVETEEVARNVLA